MKCPIGGIISNRYLYLTLEEIKCHILFLQGFKGNDEFPLWNY